MITHLHTHSYYSFLRALCPPEQLVEAAAFHGMKALALTDRHGLTGAVEFYTACQQKEIKPILGLEIKVNHPLANGDIVLLAMNRDGWRSVSRISSLIQNHPFRDPERGIDFSDLAREAKELICLTGGHHGLGQEQLRRGDHTIVLELFNSLSNVFPGRVYIELYNPGVAPLLEELAKKSELPTVVTTPILFCHSEQSNLLRIMAAVRLNSHVSLVPSNSIPQDKAHFLSPEEMRTRFKDHPAAINNIQVIVDSCNLTLPIGVPHFPSITLPPAENADSQLRSLAEKGAYERFGKITSQISQRLDYELKVIAERGYAPLFLIVQEILSFAKERGIPVSSRGSAASSLVAYCLGITTPDPLALDLYFERFLNPTRATPPDIDTDLSSERRDEVLRYVYEHYGADRVAMVATINRFRPRSALREVAKAYGMSSKEISEMVEKIPYRGWGPSSRGDDQEFPFGDQDRSRVSSRLTTIYQEAAALLQIPRHLSVHPGGIVISPIPLTDLVPTHLASKGMVITQFDLTSIEKLGLVKIDLLGTRGLTVLGTVADKIYNWNRRKFDNRLDVLEAIPDDDPDTAALIKSAQTIGCFQIESPGMRATLKEIDAESPEDLMIALALYRPGPMTGGLKSSFVKRHLGKEPVEHLHPALSTLLEETYGVILYQEQVLQIASQIAGLSLADADLLRRAMSHFDPGDRMKSLKMRFVYGALEKSDVPNETAEQIWELMAAFAGYGFPKAHAASYAQISWRSAWCKAHYPAEFMGAVLAGWGGYYPQRVYLNEARRMGLSVHPPHINHAQRQFCVVYPMGIPKLYMGLDQVRDLTKRTQGRILKYRPFHDIEDFLMRVDPRPKEAENLVQVGALRGMGTIPDLSTRLKLGGWAYGQPPLLVVNVKTEAPDWGLHKRVEAQIAILGASIDAHPVEFVKDQVDKIGAVSTSEALSHPEEDIVVAGIKQTVQRFYAHEGKPFYILELEDLEGVLQVLMSPKFYRQNRRFFSVSAPFSVEGKMIVSSITGEQVLQAKRVSPFD